MSIRLRVLFGITAASCCFLAASPVVADPCKAIPDRGPLPPYLSKKSPFSGPVIYVGDGDSLCVAVGAGAQNWVEVRIADFYAPELSSPEGPKAKAALEKITSGKAVECIADHQSYDRVVAICKIAGVSLADKMRAAGIAEGGSGHK